jgi:pilus assembly protein Flp/PilA
MKDLLIRFFKEDAGVTALEYGLIASLIALVIIVSVKSLGTKLASIFNAITAAL